jgi:hypothetical protein
MPLSKKGRLVQVIRLANLMATSVAPFLEVRLAEFSDYVEKVRGVLLSPGLLSQEEIGYMATTSEKFEAARSELLAPLWTAARAQFPSSNPNEVLVRLSTGARTFQPPEVIADPDQLAETVQAVRHLLNALIGAARANWNAVQVAAMPVHIKLVGHTMLVRPDGFLHDLVLPALHGRDTRKVGFCPWSRCGRYFVRQRKDQRACSPRCANVLRQRKNQQPKRGIVKWPEHSNAARIGGSTATTAKASATGGASAQAGRSPKKP